MNKTNHILLALLAIIMVACQGKKEETKTETYIVNEPIAVSKPDTISMHVYEKSDKVNVNSTDYNYTYKFAPANNLPIITTSAGNKYYDNTLTLTIKKGTDNFYTHTFTKESFKRFIPEKLYPNMVLMGFNFNYNKEAEHDRFYFVTSIGDPDDEEYYIPIDISIDRNGELYLSKFVDTAIDNTDTIE